MRTCVALLLVALSPACATDPAPPSHLVVGTWNVHHGAGLDGAIDLDRFAAVIRAAGADVVALQEVDVGVERSGRIDVARELAERLGMDAVFGKNIDYQGGDYGNAVLTRFPVTARRNHHYRMLREGEQRGALVVEIATPWGPLAVVSTHIDYRPDDAERWSNAAELRGLDRGTARWIVCGDFNDLPEHRVHAALVEDFVDAFEAVGLGDGASYPADGPKKRIDWILVDRALAPALRSVTVPATAASDHLPVFATFAPEAR